MHIRNACPGVPRMGKSVLAVLLCPLLCSAGCTHVVHYRDVGVVEWTATRVDPRTDAGASCISACESERFRSDDGALMVRSVWLSPPPAGEEDCRRRLRGSRFDAESGACLVGINDDAYRSCLASCRGVHVAAGRCDPVPASAGATECLETSEPVWSLNHQAGTCEEWWQENRPDDQPGWVPWCRDYTEREPNVVMIVIGLVVSGTALVLLIVVLNFDYELDWSKPD